MLTTFGSYNPDTEADAAQDWPDQDPRADVAECADEDEARFQLLQAGQLEIRTGRL